MAKSANSVYHNKQTVMPGQTVQAPATPGTGRVGVQPGVGSVPAISIPQSIAGSVPAKIVPGPGPHEIQIQIQLSKGVADTQHNNATPGLASSVGAGITDGGAGGITSSSSGITPAALLAQLIGGSSIALSSATTAVPSRVASVGDVSNGNIISLLQAPQQSGPMIGQPGVKFPSRTKSDSVMLAAASPVASPSKLPLQQHPTLSTGNIVGEKTAPVGLLDSTGAVSLQNMLASAKSLPENVQTTLQQLIASGSQPKANILTTGLPGAVISNEVGVKPTESGNHAAPATSRQTSMSEIQHILSTPPVGTRKIPSTIPSVIPTVSSAVSTQVSTTSGIFGLWRFKKIEIWERFDNFF